MVIVGVILEHGRLSSVNQAFLRTKARFYPQRMRSGQLLDHILHEVKGSEIRASLRSGSRDQRRDGLAYLEHAMRLLEASHARLIGRVWIKAPAQAMDPVASYTYAIQDIAVHFDHFLRSRGTLGLMICDSRMHRQNSQVSHSVYTQKHKMSGDAYPWLAETPTFGHSINSVGLQLADLVASALISPIAARTYCASHWNDAHVHPRFDAVRDRWADRLRRLQHRYQNELGVWRGGIVVSDRLGQLSGGRLFVVPPSIVPAAAAL